MLGQVEFTHRGQRGTATLEDDTRWTVALPDEENAEVLQHVLEMGFSLEDYSPAHGVMGRIQLREAARFLKGRVTHVKEFAPLPPGAKS